ncbi:TPA: 5-deoxy-glucuronate isomerase [Salmonella enterica subsp. salamae serovar 56:l,v:z39]|nr:5-deoxy-glucuronate isomerase [Salmonella enterica]HCM1964634.1 5-deoxy-glucuronate isomerase [Salmonella enterica subsp. salamae serovar 56:l,v:z39]
MQVLALTTLELAVCFAPGEGAFPTRLIAAQDIDGEARGKDHNQRTLCP